MDGELLFIVKMPLGKKVDIRKQWISDFSFLMQLINSAQNIRIQEAKESFASPDYLFYGKFHIVKLLYR